jgi:hypothetical protein
MKTPLLIVLTVIVLGTGSGLAVMNKPARAAITHGALQFPTSGTT